jgi:hypothetical protein
LLLKQCHLGFLHKVLPCEPKLEKWGESSKAARWRGDPEIVVKWGNGLNRQRGDKPNIQKQNRQTSLLALLDH